MTINVFDQDTGMFVSQEHQDIATIIQDYNPELHLVWIKPQDRVSATDREYPFAIMHFPRDGEPYIVMMIKENELDQRVLARLFEADQAKGDPMAKLNAANKAAQVMQEYRRSQEMEELAEFHAALLKSPLHTYRHNGKKYE